MKRIQFNMSGFMMKIKIKQELKEKQFHTSFQINFKKESLEFILQVKMKKKLLQLNKHLLIFAKKMVQLLRCINQKKKFKKLMNFSLMRHLLRNLVIYLKKSNLS